MWKVMPEDWPFASVPPHSGGVSYMVGGQIYGPMSTEAGVAHQLFLLEHHSFVPFFHLQ